MAETDDLYAQLGLSSSATTTEIAQSYAALVAANASDPASLLRLTNAFQILGNPASRTEYDRARSASPGAATDTAGQQGPGGVPSHGAIEATTMVEAGGGQAASSGRGGPGGTGPAPVLGSTVLPGTATAAGSPSPFPGVAPGPPGDVTQRPTTITCPVCGTSNLGGLDPTADYCQECGFLLSQTPGEAPDAGVLTGPRLVSVDGVREFPLQEGISAVGRQDADVLLTDTTVSRLHARLHRSGDRIEVEDANSTNGTRVNGVRLDPGGRAAVGEGDEVQFGQVAFRLRGAAPSGGGPTGTIVESGPRPAGSSAPASETPPPDVPAAARIVALTGGQVYPLYTFPARVGRRPDSAVLISDPYVSGLHAEFVEEDGALLVRDLGSTNGTVVGSEPLPGGSAAPVSAGTIITFGKQRFRVETPLEGPDGSIVWQSAAPEAPPAAQEVPASGSEPADDQNAVGESATGEGSGDIAETGASGGASDAVRETAGADEHRSADEPLTSEAGSGSVTGATAPPARSDA